MSRIVFALLVSATAVGLRDGAAQGKPRVTVEIVSALQSIAPESKWLVGIRLISDSGWHTYWKNPGDAGGPPKVVWDLQPGFRVGPLRFPAPEAISMPPFVTFGYRRSPLFPVEIDAPRDLAPGGSVTIAAKVSWVACQVECVTGEAVVKKTLSVAAQPAADSVWQRRLERAFGALPKPSESWHFLAAVIPEGYLIRVIPPPDWRQKLDSLRFFPEIAGIIDHAAPQVVVAEDSGYSIRLVRSKFATKAAPRLVGVIVSRLGWGLPGGGRGIEVDIPVEGIESVKSVKLPR